MEREDAKDLALSILIVVAALVALDCIWLHCKCASLATDVAALEKRVALIEPPPPGPTFGERAKDAYNKVKAAATAGYQAAKEKFDTEDK